MQAPRDPSARRGFHAATVFASLAALLIAFVWTAPEPALDGAAKAIAWLRADAAGRAIATTALVALGALGYVAAWTRATSLRRPLYVDGERGAIPVDQFASWMRAALLDQPDVREVAVRVENLHRRGVRIALVLSVTPHARLAEIVAEATSRVERVVRDRAAIELAEPPAIELRYEELVLGSREGRSVSERAESDAA
jgi:hypothetical protein